MNKKTLRYLWIYSAADEEVVEWHEMLIRRRQERGYDVRGLCITPPELKRRWLPFPELDRRWRRGDPALIRLYRSVLGEIGDRDVLILYNGANLHPDFARALPLVRVYSAADDPESTEILSKPAAPAFDIHLVNNIACVGMYRGWGLDHVHFWPLGSIITPEEVADLDAETIRDPASRDTGIVYIGGFSRHKQERIDRLRTAFPGAYIAGQGMPGGYIRTGTMRSTYRRSQIGWNIHNSSGPINFRTYELPAYGVMQICDNKEHLGEIYRLQKEVVGFDSIEECIELTQYYLDDTGEQREIAVRGWERWRRDYHPDQIWEILTGTIASDYEAVQKRRGDAPVPGEAGLRLRENPFFPAEDAVRRVAGLLRRLTGRMS